MNKMCSRSSGTNSELNQTLKDKLWTVRDELNPFVYSANFLLLPWGQAVCQAQRDTVVVTTVTITIIWNLISLGGLVLPWREHWFSRPELWFLDLWFRGSHATSLSLCFLIYHNEKVGPFQLLTFVKYDAYEGILRYSFCCKYGWCGMWD